MNELDQGGLLGHLPRCQCDLPPGGGCNWPHCQETPEDLNDDRYSQGPAWLWFGLSYSSYVVMPRRAICSMPIYWQERFVALMNEAALLLPEEACMEEYMVRARKDGKFIEDPNVPYRHAAPWRLRGNTGKPTEGA